MRSIVLAAVWTMALSGAALAQSLSAGGSAVSLPAGEAEKEVAAAAQAIVAAFGRSDPAAYFAHFAPEATFVFYTTPRRLESRAEYEAEWAKWEREDGFRVRACSSTDRRVQLLGDVAIFTHSVRTELSTRQGDATMLERETIVFQRQDGRWIAVHEHLSARPTQEPPVKE
jgi:ketosteroid isomerase-like protein